MIASGEWDVKDQTVLELGAGAGLPSIVAGLCGASEVSMQARMPYDCSLIPSIGCDNRLPCTRTST